MKNGMTRKALQYLCINPKFDVSKIKQGVLRYARYEKPKMIPGGLTAYGRLEMFELLPEEYMRSFVYVGWRDFTVDDQMLYTRAVRWGGSTLI